MTDSLGVKATTTSTIIVNDVAPTVSMSGPSQGTVQIPVTFTATATEPNPAEQASLAYSWNFDDGTTSNQTSPTHVFTQDGVYNVTLTVSNLNGLSTTANTIVSMFPSVTAGLDPTVNEGQTVNFAGTAVGSPDLTYHWDFGDGTTADGTLTPSHVYYSHGDYTATLTATDTDYGFSSSSTVPMIVNHVAPTVTIGVPSVSVFGQPTSFAASATSPNPADQAAGFTYAWNFGDGSTGSGASPSHTYVSGGTYSVTVTATDAEGATSSPVTVQQKVLALFQGVNTGTKGTWHGAYGSDGYNIVKNATSYPSYAQVTISGQQSYVWNASTTDPRAFRKVRRDPPTGSPLAGTPMTSPSTSI